MQVSDTNNVKIYNLSAGKSLPEWLSERKRRNLLKKNLDIRRRIELIQDFDMPGVSSTIRLSKDGQYILSTGIYTPRIKCFDVNNLSLKFERCFDSEAITFEILSDDYSKFALLQCDRYVELHVAHGRHHRLRIPKFGRDMKYHLASCDLFLVGTSADVYRLNLERGQFLAPFTSKTSSTMNKIAINNVHSLVLCGTQEGKVEAWDPRMRKEVGSLDCAMNCVSDNKILQTFPSVTSLCFNGALQLAVGTGTGHILLYDIRSNKPFLIKDHMYGYPIKDVEFHRDQNYIYSMDKSVVKIWDKNNGKLFTSIEAASDYNNLCVVPGSGLMFIANEAPKMQTYYIPSLGPAPRWASFLDSLTEELEETNAEIVYDDYKFVTQQELENLGLDHLIGTNLLRAYMHGYFMDIRLYKKAKSVANPFEFEKFRKRKIRETIEKDRTNRVQKQNSKLPKVNQDLALKLLNDQKTQNSLLEDSRFKQLFSNPNFEIDKNAPDYRLVASSLTKLNKTKKKELEKKITNEFQSLDEEREGKNSSDESSDDDDDDDDDDDNNETEEMEKSNGKLVMKQPKMFELRQGEEFKGLANMKRKTKVNATLGDRLESEHSQVNVKMLKGSIGNREMTFTTNQKKRDKLIDAKNERHREERKKLVRPTFSIRTKRNNFNRRR